MGKTAPLKKKGVSIHSRAAKRASSPSIDTDKSLKEVKPPTESKSYRPSVLAVHQNAGVSKKKKNGRALSAKARRRHEKGMDRAEAIIDRTEKKVEKSKGKARTIQARSRGWEEVNKNFAVKTQILALDQQSSSEVEGEDTGRTEDIDIDDAPKDQDGEEKLDIESAEIEDEIL